MGDVVAFQKGGYIAPFGGVIDKDLDRKGFCRRGLTAGSLGLGGSLSGRLPLHVCAYYRA